MRKLLLLLYVATSLFWGPAIEASFRLDYVEGFDTSKGIRLGSDRTVVGPYEPHWVAQPRPAPVQATRRPPTRLPVSAASGRCGGSLPSCAVMACESRGNLTVRNYEGSSATGKWQITKGTWGGYGGYAEARDAPESVQDEKARQLWAGGAGKGHWRSCL